MLSWTSTLEIVLRQPILYSLRDTNATNISIVYCRGNRDAVLIKTIHAWLLISGHLYKCNPANNYHLDGLYVLVKWKGKLCLLNFCCSFFINLVPFSCSITDQTSRVWRTCREEGINSVSEMSGVGFSFSKGIFLKNYNLFNRFDSILK